jgi:hypothetical protein
MAASRRAGLEAYSDTIEAGMEININEMTSTVRTVDSDALLAPETMKRIVAAVLEAVRERDEHRDRVDSERRVGSVWAEQVEGGRPR